VSRAKGRSGVWRVAALLAGALTQLAAGQLRASAPDQAGGAAPPAAQPNGAAQAAATRAGWDTKAVAVSRLAQARAQLAQGNIDGAEALAAEVARMKVVWTASDDTPPRVLQDVQKAKQDPKVLLQASRLYLTYRDYNRAEQYARLAERHGTVFTFGLWGDSPGKVLGEIAEARKAAPKASATARAATPTVPPATKPAEASQPVVQAGYESYEAPPAPPATTAPPAMPEAAPKAATPPPAPKAVTPAPAKKTVVNESDEARQLVKQARQMLTSKKYDEAKKLIAEARTKKANLGWWEDNPDRVEADLRRAEAAARKPAPPAKTTLVKHEAPAEFKGEDGVPKTKEEAKALLAAGRQHLSRGKIDDAARAAQRAKALTSASWGLFEDSPDRLAIDVNKARAQRDKTESARLLVEGRKLYGKGDYDGAMKMAYSAQKLHGSYSIWDLGDRPSKLLADCQAAQAKARKTVLPPSTLAKKEQKEQKAATAPPLPAPVAKKAPEAPTGDKLKAQQLVAEAQRYHREGKLVEAQQKALEAKRLNVAFAPEETSPDFVYQQVTIEVRQRVEGHFRAAQDAAAQGKMDVAEKHLADGKALAAAFGQDTKPFDAPRAAETRSAPSGVAQAVHQAPAAQATPAPTGEGAQILENARVELKKGETGNARRLTEKALMGNYGVRDEAMALLRTIDAEEFNQKQMAACKAFDAALAAYRRNEFGQASAMMAAIDLRLLDGERQSRLREVSMTPEMAQASSPGRARATDLGGKPASTAALGTTRPQTPGELTRVGAQVPADAAPLPGVPLPATVGKGQPGTSVASDAGAPDLLDNHKKMQRILYEKLRQEGLDAQRDASEKFRQGQVDAALELLQDYLANLQAEKLEPGQLAALKRPVESRLSQFRLLKAQKELANGAMVAKQTASEKLASIQRAEQMKQKNVEKLMKDYNVLFKEGKYLEAESLAMRAAELDPDNSIATAAITMARRQRAVTEYNGIKERRSELARKGLNDADDVGPSGAIDKGVEYSKEGWDRAKGRKGNEPIRLGRSTEKEKAIERQLSTPLSISFDNTPLKQVLDELRDYHGINIVTDKPALQEAGISEESPISIKLDRISLKSALNLILHQVRLTHVIKDEVLMITTEEHAKGKLITTNYPVADLVIPVEDFGNVRNGGPQPQVQNSVPNPTPTPVTGAQSMISGTAVGTPNGSPLSTGGQTSGGTTVTKRGPSNTNEEQLMKLITSTIQPKTWSEMGGPGTIEFFPLTMSLVINQTPDIQEQITDLLAALRRLQDQEVSVEVRFITVSEDFFERIGVNFNMNIVDRNARYQPMLQTNSFAFDNTNFINAFRPGRFLAGITPAGTLTPTLDIPIQQNSFFQTIPNFGGYNASGLTMGLAFLSDIQVFLFLEAAQGDTRTNVMQAPKLTLFNGQTSTITVTNAQNFVTGVTLAQLTGGQFAIIPSITTNPFNLTSLTIQAVISADRRYVRMSMTPTISNLLPGPGGSVATFPIVVPLFTSIEGFQSGQPVVLTQFVQQPVIATISISTTVAVPDGGTVLLGGLKSLSEARSEFGPPLLSKVPYINRLFKNVGYGRETESLLIMVTPRIIIQGEEEERQTGFTTPQTGAGGAGGLP
jgi:type II secretory pathway component GspD/PulD (secretin)